MAVICPTVTADNQEEYARQIANVRDFAKRLHVDLMDGKFTASHSVDLDEVWWPEGITTDIHLMHKDPESCLEQLIELKPHMVIIHNEVDVHHMYFAARLHKYGIKAGLAILQETPVDWTEQIMHSFDQILIFSGHLGYQGGRADLKLLDKVKQIKAVHPDAEIAWDGGINANNAKVLASGGIDVLNVGGYIQHSENPRAAYDNILKSLGE